MDTTQLMEYSGLVNGIANAYRRSQVLFVALEGNVFGLIAEGRDTAEAVAACAGWSVRGARMLLDGLVALELLEKENGRYRNSPAAEACLVPGAPAWQGEIIRHTRASWNAWSELETCVRTGTCAGHGENRRKGQDLRHFILGMKNIASLSAAQVLDAVDLSRYRCMLDLAGGPGTYTIAFLQRHPAMRAALLDRPEVIDIAREEVSAAGLADRIAFIPGDCFTVPWEGPYDLVFMSNIIHSFSFEQNAELVRTAFQALMPGGTLIIKDFLLENDRSGPPYGLMFALQMLVHTPAGDTYTFADTAAWTDAAGFRPGRAVPITPQTRLWIADRPAE
ncbi:MAG TPA: methyltransferase [Candidatus Hydrogenedentes bacterium]|nr:methyltransferase [Candidatus Hydrogenedentota bacterium]